MKITYINKKEIQKAQNRKGFHSICEYGNGIKIMDKEIGAICKISRKKHGHENGIYMQDIEVVERLILN